MRLHRRRSPDSEHAVGEAAHRARPTAPWRRRARAGTGLLATRGCAGALNGRARRALRDRRPVRRARLGVRRSTLGPRIRSDDGGRAHSQGQGRPQTQAPDGSRHARPQWWSSGPLLRAAWAGCAYCGEKDKPLQRDCVLALSRGGRYTLSNIVPACRSCNTSKCNDEVTGWLRRKRLDQRSLPVPAP